jgi:hypothetical protein
VPLQDTFDISWVEKELEANSSNFLPTILSIISPKTRRKLEPWWHSRSRKPFYPKSHASHMRSSHLRTHFSWTQPYEWNTTYMDGDDSTPIRGSIYEPLAHLRLWYYTVSRGQRVCRAKIESPDLAASNPLLTAATAPTRLDKCPRSRLRISLSLAVDPNRPPLFLSTTTLPVYRHLIPPCSEGSR